jgi:CHASE3 domain sensor protein
MDITQPVKWSIQSLGVVLASHIAKDEARDEKIGSMYKIIVTGGNGVPSMSETVRGHDDWINEQKESHKEKKKEKNRRSFEYQKGIILLVVGQIVALIGVAVAIFLELKK